MTAPIDIRPHDLDIVRSILKAALPASAKVWVFGSRATWTTKDSSDLDLVIDAGRKLTSTELGTLSSGFDESDLPYKVDLVDWATTSEVFRGIIERDRVELSCPPDTATLAQLARLLSGGTPSKSEPAYWTGPIPWLTPKDMGKWHGSTEQSVSQQAIGNGTRLAPKGTIFVAVRGMSLHNEIRVIRSDVALTFNQDIKAIVPNDGINGHYLYYALLAKKFELLEAVESAGHGTGVLPTDKLQSLRILNLPKSQQVAIAELFTALDDKIALNRRMNETLDVMARAIFNDWFIDFGPTRAKMEGRDPYLSADLWAMFPDKLDGEGMPEGWHIDPLLKHTRLISGGTPKTDRPEYWDGPIAWASAKDVSQCGEAFLIATERSITERGLDESATRIVPKFSTVVVARGATTGRYCLFGRDMAMNQTCYALASLSGRPFWLRCAFESLVNDLIHAAHGSVFDTITTTTVQGARVVVAEDRLLDRFETAVKPLFFRALANIEQSQTLAKTRDLLLPKLMSGEIRVADAEKIVGAAA